MNECPLVRVEMTANCREILAHRGVPDGRVLRARVFYSSGEETSPVLSIAGRPQPSTLVEVTQNRDWKSYDWATRHRAIVARNEQVKPDILLLGDSITHFWGGEPSDARARGPVSYQKYFGGFKVTNIGYGSDHHHHHPRTNAVHFAITQTPQDILGAIPTRDPDLVEREPRFRAVPLDELADGIGRTNAANGEKSNY